MLDGYGLHKLIWDTCDVLVASPADACGRGISLVVREDGAAADLTGAAVYFVWRHKVAGERETEPFTAVDAPARTFEVYYPAAMQEAEGAVQAQVIVSRGDDTYVSSRVFLIRVEPVVIGGEEHEDGFTLFLEAINAYEHATEITTAAETAANTAHTNLLATAENGDFDGANGRDGANRFSPTASVTQIANGETITVTDKNGTTTADIAKGAKSDKGNAGEQGRDRAAGADGPGRLKQHDLHARVAAGTLERGAFARPVRDAAAGILERLHHHRPLGLRLAQRLDLLRTMREHHADAEQPLRHKEVRMTRWPLSTTCKPREKAAAVTALDGTNAGSYQAQPTCSLNPAFAASRSSPTAPTLFADRTGSRRSTSQVA